MIVRTCRDYWKAGDGVNGSVVVAPGASYRGSDDRTAADPSPPERDGEESPISPIGEYHALSYADLVERLFREFENHVTLGEIADVVRESRQQLKGSPPQALPERTERLARQALTRIVAAAAADPGRTQDP
jgi:hypothetical protein